MKVTVNLPAYVTVYIEVPEDILTEEQKQLLREDVVANLEAVEGIDVIVDRAVKKLPNFVTISEFGDSEAYETKGE